jgi:hypothetical protein
MVFSITMTFSWRHLRAASASWRRSPGLRVRPAAPYRAIASAGADNFGEVEQVRV